MNYICNSKPNKDMSVNNNFTFHIRDNLLAKKELEK